MKEANCNKRGCVLFAQMFCVFVDVITLSFHVVDENNEGNKRKS